MRQKISLDPRSTDVELFSQQPLGDVWGDAELISIYQYLRRGARIPDSWDAAIAKFDNELSSHGLL